MARRIDTKRPCPSDTRMGRRLRRANSHRNWREVEHDDGPMTAPVSNECVLTPPLLRDYVFPFIAPTSMSSSLALRDGVDLKHCEQRLAPLRSVCKSWYKIVQFLLKSARSRHQTVILRKLSDSGLKQMIKDAKTSGGNVEELSMAVQNGFVGHSTSITWWSTLFAKYGNVKRLEVTYAQVEYAGVSLVCASQSLNQLEALILRDERRVDWNRAGTGIVDILVEVMRNIHGLNGGFRVITLPNFVVTASAELCRDFYAAVTSFCPKIERLMVDTKFSSSVIKTSKTDWANFCQTCTKLREYNSWMAPTTPEYLQIFLATPRSNLECVDLVIQNDAVWKDLSLLEELVRSAPMLRSIGFDLPHTHVKYHPTTLDSVITTIGTHCRGLQRLTVRFKFNVCRIRESALQTLARSTKLIHHLDVQPVAVDAPTLRELVVKLSSSEDPGELRLYLVHSAHGCSLELLKMLADGTCKLRFAIIEVLQGVCDRQSLVQSGRNDPVTRGELEQVFAAAQARLGDSIQFNVNVTQHNSNGDEVYVIQSVALQPRKGLTSQGGIVFRAPQSYW